MSSADVPGGLRLVHSTPRPPLERRQIVPNEVLGVTIFVLSELMFFAGLVSAFTISRAAAPEWPPPGQPRLPLEETAINTAALLASGALMWWAGRRFDKVGPAAARTPYAASLALGAFFVLFQGYEWARLLGEGLTLTSSTHGGFFYLIVGIHALHVMCGFYVLISQFRRLLGEQLSPGAFWGARLFWYFVVLLWPFLYWRVYL
ncbi:MAG: heme-copper oxidase subunit III [Myxococcota bacterium]